MKRTNKLLSFLLVTGCNKIEVFLFLFVTLRYSHFLVVIIYFFFCYCCKFVNLAIKQL